MINIRAMQPADILAINRIYNQESVRRFTLAMPFISLCESTRFFANVSKLHTSLVACGADGMVLGEASLTGDASPRRAYAAKLGLMVDETARRRGVGRALVTALLDLADNWLNLHKLELDVFTNNEPGIALYRALGFEIEATQRRYAMQNGVLTDSYAMARIRPGLVPDRSDPPPRPPQRPRQTFNLRTLEPEDAPRLAALMNLPGVRHGTISTPFMSDAQVQHLVTPTEDAKTIAAMAHDELIGAIILKLGKGRRSHSAYIAGLMVNDAYQGQGVGRALLGAALDIADRWLGLNRLALAVLADNPHAVRLYESFGFETEGYLRADVFRNGGYADALAMARLR